MKHKFFGEPNLLITVADIGSITFKFDENGELVMSDDNPFLQRMKNHYQHELVEEVAVETQSEQDDAAEPFKLNCRKCDFKTNDRKEFLIHHKTEHPKEVK